MPDEHVSPEALEALIDGTLGKDERAKVLAALARSEDSYDDLTESAAILAELRTSDVVTPKPIAARLPRRVYSIGISAIAAAAIAMVVISKREPAGSIVTGTLAQAVGAVGLTPSTRVAVWPETRGADENLSARARAFRLGAYLVDLEGAARRGDKAAAGAVAEKAKKLANGAAMGAPAAYSIDQFAATTADAQRITMERDVRQMSGAKEWFDIGAWIASARLATLAQNEAFFGADAAPMRSLRELVTAAERAPGESTPSQTEMIGRLKALLDGKPRGLATLAIQLDSALTEGAR
ncbi:MAG TPA: hypothetical protein VIP11_11560 [Gemmatimonadaceae bacterium]